jgi:hypothetical protein
MAKFNRAALSNYIGKKLAQPTMTNPSYTPHDQSEGQRDFKITRNINEMNFRGLTVTAIGNRLVTSNVEVKKAETFRQVRMDWNNVFMVTPTDAKRLNNPSQASFVKQPQMTVPNAYQQFYAFMKALSAAFGTLQQ